MLRETDRADGGRPKKTGNIVLPVSDSPTLSSLGLTKRESAEAQMLASIPKEAFEEIKAGIKSKADIKRENIPERGIGGDPAGPKRLAVPTLSQAGIGHHEGPILRGLVRGQWF